MQHLTLLPSVYNPPQLLTKLYNPRAFKRKLPVCRPNKQVPQDSTFAVANEGTAYSECCLVPSPQLFVIKSDKRLEKVIANTYSSIRPQSLHHLK